ncbi:MAG: hypothetical protein DMG38_04245 [Acidobacteria bacterium]|nr:MAG: hypothetical protein DMG38_04245 [Acidobacteriota bacterium]
MEKPTQALFAPISLTKPSPAPRDFIAYCHVPVMKKALHYITPRAAIVQDPAFLCFDGFIAQLYAF